MTGSITQESFGKAYEHGHQRTVNFLMSKGFPEQEAVEAAQAAWVRAWERRSQLRNTERTTPWVNSIALNMGRTRLRREAMFQELEREVPTAHSGMYVAATVDVHRMLRECPEKDRVLLEKRYLEEREIKDLARENRCTTQAIRVRLHRARRALREQFEMRTRCALQHRCQSLSQVAA
jgi:RNA polymerase sigma-70 factor (ECF subfamily)